MSSIPSIPIPISDIPSELATTLGALFIGSTIAAVCYGITILQTVVYYKLNPGDPWIFRYSVALLWILDTLHVALSTHALYFYLIELFGNYIALLSRIIWSFPLQLLINVLINSAVQALYAVRIWKLSRSFKMVLPQFIFIPVAATFGTGLYVIYDAYTLSSFLGVSNIRPCIYTVFSTMSAADFIIAGVMCFCLHKGKTEMTTISSTTKTIVKLMRIVVISGLLTSTCSLFTLISYIIWPDTLIFFAIGTFVLPKLYINSLLAMLNSRKSSMWSVGKQRYADPKMIRFSPHDAENGAADSGQTDVTIPGLSGTGTDANVNLSFHAAERSHLSSAGDMTFA
ncbi:uncharacterized protein EV420DRAFT_1549932 [Desarmillaria tabescens]|uniref:DUF6534 domain-containing protein n=1 Tax=Armillaria tabescens TaxID=1929756 RepID=A0AA39K9Y0_ARMTA|nr:uncharacterized protein EV420DRAFT_1549932 [Desarmillaria tabescens]KAK0457282.1 hypothetical protein EV420DRAFT_1549932 [Desarmillaria tabescens]